MAPSTDWREQIDGDEEQRFAGFAERIAAMQKRALLPFKWVARG
jgi:hypothetical protein